MIIKGDCIEEMKKLEENSVDAIIIDPPYGLEFMGKEWDSFKKSTDNIETEKKNPYYRSNIRHRIKAGVSQPALQEFFFEWALECLRVLKHGGFLLSFGGTRTYHRMTCGIEDAGFEIRDTIMWLYGSGFPKSLNIGKQIDKIQGNERKVIGYKEPFGREGRKTPMGFGEGLYEGKTCPNLKPIEESHSEWEGWGTALKPAVEPIVVARKPLSEKNIALNVLKHGTGGLNIDECRVEVNMNKEGGNAKRINKTYKGKSAIWDNADKPTTFSGYSQGRFPANIILDEEAGKMLDKQSGDSSGGKRNNTVVRAENSTSFGGEKGRIMNRKEHNDKGGASRFFYCAKASKSERNYGCEGLGEKQQDLSRKEGNVGGDNPRNRGVHKRKNNHPTVKPIALIEYLIKLVSRKGSIVLDPFLGSGTTAIASLKLERQFIGIEKEEEYSEIANKRLKPFREQRKL